MSELGEIDKIALAESFSKAAETYDQVAHLQRKIGDNLIAESPWLIKTQSDSKRLLDVGCGTGYFLPSLPKLVEEAHHSCGFQNNDFQTVAIDLAEGMVRHARNHHAEAGFVVADMESLPFSADTFDVIFSSLAMQWSEDLSKVLSDCWRIVKPGGGVYFSTLLDGTLRELASSWAAADDYQHVNRFMTKAALSDIVETAGFSEQVIVTESIQLQYDDVRGLTNELKKLGAHNVNRRRSHGMTGKEAIRTFKKTYEGFRRNGKLPATYEVAYVYLKK